MQIDPIKIIILGLIIFFLAITSLSALISATSVAGDQIRLQEVSLIRQFLKAYKTNQGTYPPSTLNKPAGWQQYLEFLPNPAPASNCSADDNQYAYTLVPGGQKYQLEFCLHNNSGKFHSGKNSVGPDSP
jgi:type II secretory pathway pseudopilin PulG